MPSANVYSSVDRFWTDQRVAELKRLFDNGLSNNQIAVEMDIKSRNAVIGKLHRLGLTRGSGQDAKQSNGARGIVKRAQAPKPQTQRPMEAFVRTRPIQADTAFDVHYIEVEKEADGITDLSIYFANRVSLLSVGADQCRWPAADDGSATMVCGAPVCAGSYCARHALRSVRHPVASQREMAGVP